MCISDSIEAFSRVVQVDIAFKVITTVALVSCVLQLGGAYKCECHTGLFMGQKVDMALSNKSKQSTVTGGAHYLLTSNTHIG